MEKKVIISLLVSITVLDVVGSLQLTTGTWNSWSSCSKTCGGGTRTRTFIRCNLNGWWRSCNSNISGPSTVTCNEFCMNGGSYVNNKCSCAQGTKGDCCDDIPVCNPQCENTGVCISDGMCKCAPGFYGKLCEIGNDVDDKLKPQLNTSIDINELFHPFSWYDEQDISDNNRVCFVKIHIQSAPYDTVVTATTYTKDMSSYGYFSTAPLDSLARTDNDSRFACLQVRCPHFSSNGSGFNSVLRIEVSTRYKTCHVSNHINGLTNFTVDSRAGKSDLFGFELEVGNNYGPYYGIYIGTGYRDRAKYISEHKCFSGHQFDFNHFNPEDGVLANIQCT